MIPVGRSIIVTIMPTAKNIVDTWVEPLNKSMFKWQIHTPLRQAAFLAQVAHESGELKYVKELASGEAYDTGSLAKRLGNTPEDDDDGRKYKGRGLIQVTGTNNYRDAAYALSLPLLDHPEMLELPVYAADSAGWFFYKTGCNEAADIPDFKKVTKIINGGYNGWMDRLKYYERAKAVLL